MSTGTAPDRWLVIRVARPPDPEAQERVVELLMGLPVRGVEEREDAFVVYLPDSEASDEGDAQGPHRWTSFLSGALSQALCQAGVDDPPPEVTWGWQPHEAWEESWRRGLAPRRITPRLVVSPSWEDPELEPGDLLVVVDPGMAFGTAEHATTRGCLRLLDRFVKGGERVADVGAGSGILSIAAAGLGADQVVAVEGDPWACEAIRENAELNGVSHRIRLLCRMVDPAFLPHEAPFDGIVANIESGVILPLLPGFRAGLAAGGWLIVSGILATERDRIVEEAGGVGLRLVDQDREGDWWSGAFVTAQSDDGDASPA